MADILWNSSVCSVVILVVVQPGDQLLSPERRTSIPKVAREDDVDSDTQSKSRSFPLPRVFGGLRFIPGRGLLRAWCGCLTCPWLCPARPGAGGSAFCAPLQACSAVWLSMTPHPAGCPAQLIGLQEGEVNAST